MCVCVCVCERERERVRERERENGRYRQTETKRRKSGWAGKARHESDGQEDDTDSGVLAGNNKQRVGAAFCCGVWSQGVGPIVRRVVVHCDFTSSELKATGTAATRHPQKATHGSHSDARCSSKKELVEKYLFVFFFFSLMGLYVCT